MIQQVADALKQAFKDRVSEGTKPFNNGVALTFEQTGVVLPSDDVWAAYARVAIVAMRKPNAVMRACGRNAGWHMGIDNDPEAEEEAAESLYQFMIDKALEE